MAHSLPSPSCDVHTGDVVGCPRCGAGHPLEETIDPRRQRGSEEILVYRCEGECFVGAIDRRTVFGLRCERAA